MGEPSGKKRKRSKESGEPERRKKNKVALEERLPVSTGPSHVRVTSILKSGFAPPVIAVTPGITLDKSTEFRSYAKQKNQTERRRKHDSAEISQELLLHSTSHRALDYVACEEAPDGQASVLKHYIGLFDPATGKLEFAEAKKMAVRGMVRSQQKSSKKPSERNGHQTHSERKNELGEAFGTKKAKKAIRSVAENAISGDAMMGSAEHSLMENVKESTSHMASREELQAQVDEARPVPRGHYDAEEIGDVYVPAEIIGADVLHAIPIMDWQEKVKKGENIRVPSRFVAQRIARLASNEDAVQRLRILRFLLFLIVFSATCKRAKRVRGVLEAPRRDEFRAAMGEEGFGETPDSVLDSIRRRFTSQQGDSRLGELRKPHTDLLMTTCCTLAAIVDGFEVDTRELYEDLRLEQKQISQYFMEIGARVKQSKSGDRVTYHAKLQLPLVFPKIRIPARRR